MAKRILILCGTFMLGGALIGPEDLSSCGPFLPETVFTSKDQPLDDARFFGGHLDILQPHYRRIYLMAAYRYLAGVGLTTADQQALLAKPTAPDYFWFNQSSPAIQAWLQARLQVGAPPFEPGDPDPINHVKILPGYLAILNCGDDAFRNATATLVERGRAGASHDDLRAWVAAQDQVFTNCSDPQPWQPHPRPAGPVIPAALPATAAPWMHAGPRLPDRCRGVLRRPVRCGIGGFPAHRRRSLLALARHRALPRRARPDPQNHHRRVRCRSRPGATAQGVGRSGCRRLARERPRPAALPARPHASRISVLRELAHTVATEKTGVAGTMQDYRLMLDRYANRNQDAPRDEDIADWIAAMQYTSDDHALAKWRATRTLPWLVAALSYADKPEPDLMATAAQVSADSPAFPTVEFHRLRLMLPPAARPGLDAALRRKMPVSARNLFLAARMRVSRNWDDLLRYAPRTVTGTFVEGWYGEYQPVTGRELYFDDDAAQILDRQAPLAMLRLAAGSRSLPSGLQLQVARAVWVRSILLHDTSTAAGIAPVIASLAPRLKPYADGYLAAPDEKARAFEAAWWMLNDPGMRPSIDAGAGRLTPAPKIDPFRGNWWCPMQPGDATEAGQRSMNGPLELLYQGSSPEAGFLTAAQHAAAKRERERLAAAPAAPTLLARNAVTWVQAHPDDPRAPEALHLAVRAGHFACAGDADTDRWVKRAFQLLHMRYPKTEAARRTPYWFKAGTR